MPKILVSTPGEGSYYMEGPAFDFWTSVRRHCYLFGDEHTWDHDCGHDSCAFYRDNDARAFLDGRCTWYFDENWGRFLPAEQRKRYHDMLVFASVEKGEVDENGLPRFDIMSGVWAGVSYSIKSTAVRTITEVK